MPKKVIIYISGLHCVACETFITQEFQSLPGVSNLNLDRQSGQLEMIIDREIDFEPIFAKLGEHGYQAGWEKKTPKRIFQLKEYLYAGLIVAVLIILYRFLKYLGMLDFIFLDDEQVSWGFSFVVGLVASISTCLAVVGSVVISFAAKYRKQSLILANIYFQLGRLASFFIFGGLLGLIGDTIGFNTTMVGIIMLLLGVILLLLGLNLLGILTLAKLNFRPPKKSLEIWEKAKSSNHHLAPIFIGAATFLLPCGFTQSMQIMAVGTGSFFSGGLLMFMFALGTLPVLFILGITSGKLSGAKNKIFSLVIAFLIVIFGINFIFSGVTLFDWRKTNNENVNLEISTAEVQEIRMEVGASSFTPNIFKIKAGVPVRWVINGKNLSGCTNEIIVPDLNISKKLIRGENVLTFTPIQKGTINFSCWMGMVRGKFIVE